MTKKKLAEGMGSVNVETQYDVSSIKRLAGLANETTVAGTTIKESIDSDVSANEARELADELERHLHDMSVALENIEALVRNHLPREYRSMEAYTFAHIKTSLGGYGYVDRMSKSIESLIEDLRIHAEDNPDEE